ncbi:MAG: L-serine ammonia-lyase [Sporocytophaga sp.]|uniref:L-serine ammonia-lyase n=1 Tax=Sporocytophaga sp. TaxID=2231183 RepID=UPI001B1A88E2|nr:L-serine ammonia-lyase [Sporocytophaga sp.]MBO9702068.1 L-serine ammonia-lyase [Sporocytophaga sp.]
MGYLSVFDMLKIGIGPSSSHTFGPWTAARKWINELVLSTTPFNEIKVELYGSLALTGKGHCTDKAILFGLMSLDPEEVDENLLDFYFDSARENKMIVLGPVRIKFDLNSDIKFLKNTVLPYHSNGMKFKAYLNEALVSEDIFYSIGGGFIVKEGEAESTLTENKTLPYPCPNPKDLVTTALKHGLSISELVLENEKILRPEVEIKARLIKLWSVMKNAAYAGCHQDGVLPGGLEVKRRAAALNKQLLRVHDYNNADEWMEAMKVGRDFKKVITRISCLALAINEVNASMGRIVTAPTNGSAGVIPAVLFYYICFSGQQVKDDDICRFLLTAGEIGKYFKLGATISAAAGGCQAEIGVSSSMAAAALTECLGGAPAQVLMAAEIAAEHHLGLTCDPVGGLVQIPCIERNSMGAIKAITASMMSLAGNPDYAKVSLENVISTMKQTAENMSEKFKETSLGGLAVNVSVNIPEC